MPDRGDDGAGAVGGGRAQRATGSPCATPRSRPHRDGGAFLLFIHCSRARGPRRGVSRPTRRRRRCADATDPIEPPGRRCGCWPTLLIPFSRLPDRGERWSSGGMEFGRSGRTMLRSTAPCQCWPGRGGGRATGSSNNDAKFCSTDTEDRRARAAAHNRMDRLCQKDLRGSRAALSLSGALHPSGRYHQ
jgi:hypothetical protein